MFMQSAIRSSKSILLALNRHAPQISSLAYVPLAMKRGCRLRFTGSYLSICRGNKVVRLSHRHQIYVPLVTAEFDFFHGAVRPEYTGGLEVADYSSRRPHYAKGFDLHPLVFPSLGEPVDTSRQYIELAGIKRGDAVLDLGAYSGLSSILFKEAVGDDGRVVAVDADPGNLECIRANLAAYFGASGSEVDTLFAAVWREDGEIDFSAEGSMGSSAVETVGDQRAASVKVPALTLSTLADRVQMARVDVIKADIEGAEAFAFDRPAFFAKHRPRIVAEVHPIKGKLTTEPLRASLERHGYKVEVCEQPGSPWPLVRGLPG